MDAFSQTFSERGVHGKFFGKFSQNFFLGKTSETSYYFSIDLIKFLKKDIFFILLYNKPNKTSYHFSTDLKKDIFFILLDPRLSVKKRVGVYLALIHFFESFASSFQQQSNNHNKIPV